MPLKRPGAAPNGRAGWPPERGEIHPLQPHHRHPARPSSRRWPGRPGTPSPSRPSGRANHFSLVDTGGMFGATDRSAPRAGRRARPQSDCYGGPCRLRGGRPGGAGPGRRGDCAAPRVRSTRPVIIAVNKTDDRRLEGAARRVLQPRLRADRRDRRRARRRASAICSTRSSRASPRAPARRRRRAKDVETRVAIVGRPNVGKSSLLNRLLKEERSIVSDMPGTTRDTVDAVLKWQKRTFRILDTAGIRRPGRVARAGQVEAVARRDRAARDREGRRRRAGRRRGRRGHRSGRDDCRRGRQGRRRRHHRRQQVGPDEGARPGLLEGVRRQAAPAR